MPGAVANPKKGGKGPQEHDDAFIRTVDRIAAWVRANTVTVVVTAVALALVVGGALWYVSYQQNLEERATQRLTTLRSEIATGQNPNPVSALSTFLGRFEGTRAETEARILLTRQQMISGSPSEAVSTVQPAVDATNPDSPTGFATRRLQAQALEAAGETERALALLETLSERARFGFQRRQVAAERARILRQAGRLEEALAIYERLAEEAGEADAATLYAVRAGEIRGLMAGGGGSTASGGASDAPASTSEAPAEPGAADTSGGSASEDGDAPGS